MPVPFYQVTIEEALRPDPDEITAAEYVPLVEASALLCDDLMRQVVTAVANFALREDPR